MSYFTHGTVQCQLRNSLVFSEQYHCIKNAGPIKEPKISCGIGQTYLNMI